MCIFSWTSYTNANLFYCWAKNVTCDSSHSLLFVHPRWHFSSDHWWDHHAVGVSAPPYHGWPCSTTSTPCWSTCLSHHGTWTGYHDPVWHTILSCAAQLMPAFDKIQKAEMPYMTKNKANLRDLKAATGQVMLLKLDSNHRFLAGVTLKFDGWPRKIIHLYNIKLCVSFHCYVYHFISISEFKLELQSGNAQFGSNSTISRAVWPWNLTDDLEK